MKKIALFLVAIGLFTMLSCSTSDEEVVDNDTIALNFENKFGFNFTASNDYTVRFVFPETIYESDMVLVYRFAGTSGGADLWEFLPETYYFEDGTRDFSYNFNFTTNFADIYLNGNDLASVPPNKRIDQFFRVVVVPANLVFAMDSKKYEDVINVLKDSGEKMEIFAF